MNDFSGRGSEWHYKGYGRVFVNRVEHIEPVEKLIRQLDPEEYDSYGPKDLVGLFDYELVYLGKFEIHQDAITSLCFSAGYPVWCYSTHENYFPKHLRF